MKTSTQIALIALMACATSLQAATHYSCDFENEADRARWILNPTANQTIYSHLANKWYIGAIGNYALGGQYGLYISDDGGATGHYTNASCWVAAYDTISLDHLSSGDYTLTFDYCGRGNAATDGLYVLWIPVEEDIHPMSIATFSCVIPAVYEDYVMTLADKTENLNEALTWTQCSATLPNKRCDGTPHYLVFVWANGSQTAMQPAGKIDNITISDTRPCEAPTNLSFSTQGTTSVLSWSGNASEYEVIAYSYEAQKWYGPQIVLSTQAAFKNLPIGQTDFVVRAKCTEDHYSLKQILSKLVYYPDLLCVDYLDLEKANCYVGELPGSSSSSQTFDDYTLTAPVDYGPSSIESRHTVHFDKNEVEPRTGGLAHTVPDGEIASVRLGNWKNGAETERIEYTFVVDTIMSPILLLKYMPILEAPRHDGPQNPSFKMDILVEKQSLGTCVQIDFNGTDVYDFNDRKLLPGAAEQGWHVTPQELAQANNSEVVWKEWSTLGVNLKHPEYQGKELTIRLTTFDCAYVAHCGYAYFTIGCSDDKLKNMKCAEINPILEAPDGFNYRWAYASSEQYRDAVTGSFPEQYVLGRNKLFDAGMHDDNLYVVDCMSMQDSTCYFSLYATTLITNPVAVIKEPIIEYNSPKERYMVTFDGSDSWVQEINHVKADTMPSRIYHIDNYEWSVNGLPGGWSDKVKPTFEFPATGGDFVVYLTVRTDLCDAMVSYNLHLDPATIEGIQEPQIDAQATKLLRDGQLLILRGNKTYTITGQEIK